MPNKPDKPHKDKTEGPSPEAAGLVKEDARPNEGETDHGPGPGPDHTPEYSQNYKRTLSYIIIAVIILISIVARYSKTPEKTKTYVRLLMGTVVEITLHGKERESPEARAAADAAFIEIERLEALLSRYRPESDVSMIRRAAVKVPGEKSAAVKVSPEVIEVVELALEAARLSDGAFDPTIGPVTSLWDFSDMDDGTVPSHKEIEARLALVGYKHVVVDKASGTVALGTNMSLDLGGVAKGYIIGRAIEILKEHGIKWAIATAGGDIYAFDDESLLGGGFSIGVRDPRSPSRLVGTVTVKDGAVTTSGDYERYFIEDGVRYHHIIDPRTGYPVGVGAGDLRSADPTTDPSKGKPLEEGGMGQGGNPLTSPPLTGGDRGEGEVVGLYKEKSETLMSVTIVSKRAAMADALSTAVFVMGATEGMALIERLPWAEGAMVDRSGVITTSKGLEGDFGEGEG